MSSTLTTRLHRTFWLLLFVVFPLAYVPAPVLESLPQTWVRFPKGEQPDAFIPKIVVFVVVWLLGAGLAGASLRGRGQPLPPAARRTLAWCAAFVGVLLASSLFTSSYSNVVLPYLGNRLEGVLLTLFEAAWYSFTPLAAVLAAQRVVSLNFLLNAVAVGALAVGGWTLAEAYGFAPLALVLPGSSVGGNLRATLGHQGYVAAYLGVVLVFWAVWRGVDEAAPPGRRRRGGAGCRSGGERRPGRSARGRAGPFLVRPLHAALRRLPKDGRRSVRRFEFGGLGGGAHLRARPDPPGARRHRGAGRRPERPAPVSVLAARPQGHSPKPAGGLRALLFFERRLARRRPARCSSPHRRLFADRAGAGRGARGQDSFLPRPNDTALARQGHEPLRGSQLPARPESCQRSARRAAVRRVRGSLRPATVPAPGRHSPRPRCSR